MALLRVNVSALIVVAGFQVIIGGRFWVITEARLISVGLVDRRGICPSNVLVFSGEPPPERSEEG